MQQATKNHNSIPKLLTLWKSLVFNAFKHLLVFCPMDPRTLGHLTRAQETWARAFLWWEPHLSGPAAVSDLGWLHITRELTLTKCSLFVRLADLPTNPVFSRIKDIMDAAEHVSLGWSHRSKAMLQAATTPIPFPMLDTAWRASCCLPDVTSHG